MALTTHSFPRARLRSMVRRCWGGTIACLATGACLVFAPAGCFSSAATEGLPCESDEDCAGDQTCADVGQCVAAGSSGRPTSGPCSAGDQGKLRCSSAGPDVLEQCTGGQWEQLSCNTLCQQEQEGVCVWEEGVCQPGVGGGNAGCACANEAVMPCDPSQDLQGTCSDSNSFLFCDAETAFQLRETCDCLCAQAGYPAQGTGPCLAEPNDPCYCADSTGSSCAMAEEGMRTCLPDNLGFEECVQGTRYRTDCFAQCEREAAENPSNALCDLSLASGCACE